MIEACLAAVALVLSAQEPLRDKTLVVWVAPANLDQRSGSALTLDDLEGRFDGIVFGEIEPRRWMPGSEYYRRTQRDQSSWPAETADATTFVQVAIVYRGRSIALYRNGEEIAAYEVGDPKSLLELGSQVAVVSGIRHLAQGDDAHFAGAIEDMRVYSVPLTAQEIAALRPDEQADESPVPEPWAWWKFDGSANEATGRFAATALVGGAKVEGGRLILDGETGVLVAARTQADLEAILPGVPDPTLRSDIEASRRFRHRLLADRHRPLYHFVIPEDYAMPFDPNGAIFWRGRYHLFYIYQERGVHVFGHASSLDLLHWRHHPPALFPTPDSPEKGIFSGNCFVNKDGEATMVYHGVGAGNCMATSSDDQLERWTKLPTNPFIPFPPEGAPYRAWDPFGWLEGDTYYAISGGERAAVFKAARLTDRWTYVGDLLHHTVPGVDLREDISCADFFKLGGKHVLICISHRLGARYYVGDWKGEQFHPEVHEQMSWSDNLYFAPETLEDDRGRRILWAWIFDRRPDALRRASGWSGEMALPRELALGPDNRLRFKPIEELKRLRFDERAFGPIELEPGATRPLEGLSGDALELEIELELGSARRAGVEVRRSPDGAERMPVFVDLEKKALSVGDEAGPFQPEGSSVVLRVFVDRGVVEAFADDRQAVVRRSYPTRKDSMGVALFAEGGSASVRRMRSWRMFPSNPY